MAADRVPDEALLVTLLEMSSGEAPAEKYAELSRRVADDPVVCQRVVNGMVHIADLEWEFAPASVGPRPGSSTGARALGAGPTDSARSPMRPPSPIRMATWRVAAGLLVAFVGGVVCSRYYSGTVLEPPIVQLSPMLPGEMVRLGDTQDGPLATLVRNTSYIIDTHAGTAIGAGSSLHAGSSVALFDGVAELEFDNSVSVLLKGPAILVLGADGRPFLKYGGLVTRHVPENSSWRLSIPMSELEVRSGAVVGVDAFGEEAVVHALEGEATVVPASGKLGPLVLAQGEAVRLRRNARSELSLLPIAARPESFDFEARMDDGRLDIPADYAEGVMRSRPVAYWRFDNIESGAVVDESGGAHSLHLLGEGVRVVRGSGNSYVSFDVRDKRGCFVSGAPLDGLAGQDYSVEFWFKPRHYHRGSVVSLVEHATDLHGAVERHGLIVETNSASPMSPAPEGVETSPRAIRFLHRSPPDDLLSGATCFSQAPYRLNAWQHVVAVKDEKSLRLYVDGELSSTQPDPTRLPSGLSIVVGQLFSFGSVRPYVGELDELAFYDHALSKEERSERVSWLKPLPFPSRPSGGANE